MSRPSKIQKYEAKGTNPYTLYHTIARYSKPTLYGSPSDSDKGPMSRSAHVGGSSCQGKQGGSRLQQRQAAAETGLDARWVLLCNYKKSLPPMADPGEQTDQPLFHLTGIDIFWGILLHVFSYIFLQFLHILHISFDIFFVLLARYYIWLAIV